MLRWRRLRMCLKDRHMTWIIALLIALVATPARAIDCQESYPTEQRPADWAWRTIDGRQCWYQGPKMLPKHNLKWPSQPKQEAIQEPSQPKQEAIQEARPPSFIMFNDNDFNGRWQAMYEPYWRNTSPIAD
jgi:hypothetical protein